MSSFNYDRINQDVFRKFREAWEARGMYIILEKEYVAKDMIHFDGENVEAWINADLRRAAIIEGYSIHTSEMDEVELSWNDKLRMSVNMDERDDGVAIYRAVLQTPQELTRSDGYVTPSVYATM